ncbi:MAG TPA: nucleotidyltransferase family protein [Allocoleopsis sp.]
MSKRSITIDLPVSILREITEVAKLQNKSIEQIALEAIASQFSLVKKPLTKDEVLTIIREHKEQLQKMGVKSLELFGSVARDEANIDSDIDFLVEFEGKTGLFKLLEVQYYLEDILGCPVDLGTKDSLKNNLQPQVLKELINT